MSTSAEENESDGGDDGVPTDWCFTEINANFSGLEASSVHAFHILKFGDLSSSDCSSEEGHFSNPAGDDIPHGYPGDAVRHRGDLGNVTNDSDGNATNSFAFHVIRLGGIVERGITLHAEDDKGAAAQPSVGAGSLVEYGVIGYIKTE